VIGVPSRPTFAAPPEAATRHDSRTQDPRLPLRTTRRHPCASRPPRPGRSGRSAPADSASPASPSSPGPEFAARLTPGMITTYAGPPLPVPERPRDTARA
jgi:hypothetical protein